MEDSMKGTPVQGTQGGNAWDPDTKLVDLLAQTNTSLMLPHNDAIKGEIVLSDLWRKNGWCLKGQDVAGTPENEHLNKSLGRMNKLTGGDITAINHAFEMHLKARNAGTRDPKKAKWHHCNLADTNPCGCSWCAAVVSPDDEG